MRLSLKRRIAVTFLLCHVAITLAALVAIKPIVMTSDEGIQLGPAVIIEAAIETLGTARGGRPAFESGGRLAELRAANPRAWLIARTPTGTTAVGRAPDEASRLMRVLPPGLEAADLRLSSWKAPFGDVAIERHPTRAGTALLMVGGVDPSGIGWRHWFAYLVGGRMIWTVPLVAALAIPAVLLATPVALRSLRVIVRDAERIGPGRPRRRLNLDRTPRELMPLAGAVNGALDRLEGELDRSRRLIANVSHELRTPLAILGLRIESLPPGEARTDLERSQMRLTRMVEQMLDAERAAMSGLVTAHVDLVQIARAVVADAAPLAIRAGYSIGLSGEGRPVIVAGDHHAISRALYNLVGNAVAHGGGRGLIDVGVHPNRTMDVIDEGTGIPASSRDRVFEPFHRERWDRDGCGLGLHLVQETMRAHGGFASVIEGPHGHFRLSFPEHEPARHA